MLLKSVRRKVLAPYSPPPPEGTDRVKNVKNTKFFISYYGFFRFSKISYQAFIFQTFLNSHVHESKLPPHWAALVQKLYGASFP